MMHRTGHEIDQSCTFAALHRQNDALKSKQHHCSPENERRKTTHNLTHLKHEQTGQMLLVSCCLFPWFSSAQTVQNAILGDIIKIISTTGTRGDNLK